MAMRHRHGEFAEQPADDAAHQQQRDEHGDQREADRDDGEADLADALERRLRAASSPSSIWRVMFSSIDDGVVDDEADRDGQRHQRQVVEAVAERATSARSAPSSASGTVTLGITVAHKLRRNTKITITTSAMVSSSVNCTSLTEARMVCVRSLRT